MEAANDKLKADMQVNHRTGRHSVLPFLCDYPPQANGAHLVTWQIF